MLENEGISISNLGNYLKGLVDYDHRVSKPYRGHYFYSPGDELETEGIQNQNEEVVPTVTSYP
ncbi:hypothetical protein GJU40_15100 [Bacillus lacus]|uniref:Repressor Rok winged helix domain-containing protein n=1 Tax=Metabacillus lacus TaxID=1983721 RepID=A0A7X2J1C1_9BACI|nr:hypothetical protein [Metabacillus lacus]MRX73469.1 hypothetical protein [Metabacillus lacus]